MAKLGSGAMECLWLQFTNALNLSIQSQQADSEGCQLAQPQACCRQATSRQPLTSVQGVYVLCAQVCEGGDQEELTNGVRLT